MKQLDPLPRRIAKVVVLGAVMSTLDTTIVNVALASLARDLHADLDTVQWVVSAYLLSLAAVIPLGGWAVRRIGAYRVYLLALLLFTLGSGLCALATSATQLIVFRVLQGLGGGLIMPTGMTMLVRASDPKSLPQVMSAIGTPMVLAPILGPTVGGLLLEHVGWSAIFAINVPVGVVAGVVAMRLLPRDHGEEDLAGMDWAGLVLAVTGLVSLTYGLSRSAATGDPLAGEVWGPVVAGALLIGLFIVHARRATAPLLDLGLYALPRYASASVAMLCLNAALFGSMILLPLYLQDVRGLDAASTGLLLIPQGLGAALGMNRSAWFEDRLGSGRTALLGMTTVIVCTAPFMLLAPDTSYLLLCLAMAFRGVGVGFAVNATNTTAFSELSPSQVVDANPQINVLQRVGASLGTAATAVILQNLLPPSPGTARQVTDAFDVTYRFVMGITLVALLSAVYLRRVEQRQSTSPGIGLLPDPAPA